MSAEKKRKLAGSCICYERLVFSVSPMSGEQHKVDLDLSSCDDSGQNVSIRKLKIEIAKMVTDKKLFRNEFSGHEEDGFEYGIWSMKSIWSRRTDLRKSVHKHFCGAWRIEILDDSSEEDVKLFSNDSAISIERLQEAAGLAAESETNRVRHNRPLLFLIRSGYREVKIASGEDFAKHFKVGATEDGLWLDGEIDIGKISKCDELIAYTFSLDTDEMEYSDLGNDGNFHPQIAEVCNLLLSHKSKCVLRAIRFASSDVLTGQFFESFGTKIDTALITSPLCPLEEVELFRTEVYPFGHVPHLRLTEYWNHEEERDVTDWAKLRAAQASSDFQSSKTFSVQNATFVASWGGLEAQVEEATPKYTKLAGARNRLVEQHTELTVAAKALSDAVSTCVKSKIGGLNVPMHLQDVEATTMHFDWTSILARGWAQESCAYYDPKAENVFLMCMMYISARRVPTGGWRGIFGFKVHQLCVDIAFRAMQPCNQAAHQELEQLMDVAAEGVGARNHALRCFETMLATKASA